IYNIYLKELGDAGIVLTSLIMIFSALRLARFNVQLVGLNKEKFSGLPAPMSAFTICTFVLFYFDKILSKDQSITVLIALSVLLPVLMVSRIKYDTLPKPSLSSIRKNFVPYFVIVLAAILIIFTGGEGSFSFCLFYIFSGIFKTLKNKMFKGKRHHGTDEIINETIETGK
ncbi:MAG: hypothetical protein WBC65_15860, partial [Ignavibacteria bacterium]